MPPPMMAARRRPTTRHLLEWRIWLACWVVLRWEPLFLGIPILFLHTGITLSFLTRWVILQYTSCRSSLPLLFFMRKSVDKPIDGTQVLLYYVRRSLFSKQHIS